MEVGYTTENLGRDIYNASVELVHRYCEFRIAVVLGKLEKAFERVGWGVSGVYYTGNGQGITAHPDGAEYGTRDQIESDFDVTFTIVESVESDGSLDGINFSLQITTIGGNIIGDFTPYNYTDEVWVPLHDAEAIEKRFAMVERIDIEGTVETIQQYLTMRTHVRPEEYSKEHLAGTSKMSLGLALMDWHDGQGSGVYAVGSTLYAGHEPDLDSVARAIDELKHPFRGTNYPKAITPEDVQAQANLAAELEYRFPEKETVE